MKIAIISTPFMAAKPYRLFTGYGGLEKIAGTLAEEFAKRGHQVTLIGGPGTYADQCKIVEVPGMLHEEAAMQGWTFPNGQTWPGYRQALDECDHWMDHSWQHWPTYRLAESTQGAQLDSGHTIQICHHGVLGDIRSKPPLPKPCWTAFSKAQAGMISAVLGVETRYAHHGVDTELFRPTAGNREDYYLILSRLSPEKGIVPALRAVKKAKKRAVLIGDDKLIADRNYVQQVFAECDGWSVKWLGSLSLDQMLPWLQTAKALIHTPLSWAPQGPWMEIFGLNVAEAMSCGVPVLGSRNGAIPEQIVDQVTGLLVDSPDDLVPLLEASAVETLQSSACREHAVKHFSLAAMTDRHEALLEEATKKGGW